MRRYVISFCIVLIMLAIFASCSVNEDTQRYTGVLANDEVIASVKQEIEDRENSLLATEGDVFWTASGKLWHATYSCSYIINSKNIYHGTIDDALLAGKESPCRRCGALSLGGVDDEKYKPLEGKPIEDGDVFFTKSSSLYHKDINCPYLDGAAKIYHSDINTADKLGKVLECEECGD